MTNLKTIANTIKHNNQECFKKCKFIVSDNVVCHHKKAILDLVTIWAYDFEDCTEKDLIKILTDIKELLK